MSFKYTEEQEAIKDSVRGFFESEISSDYLRSRIDGGGSFDKKLWGKIATLGLAEFFSSEDAASSSFRELSIIAEESGRALLPEPLTQSLFLGPYLFSTLKALKHELASLWPDSLKAGTAICCSAPLQENLALKIARQKKGDLSISGEIPYVRSPFGCEFLFVPIEFEGADQIALIHLTKGSSDIQEGGSLDLSAKIAKVSVKGATVSLLKGEIIERLKSYEMILVCAEMLGACGKVMELTTEYVKTRKQFDVPVGGFQAVQHKISDMYLAYDSMRSLIAFASWAAENSPEQLILSSRAALMHCCEVAPKLVESAIQVHGGIGFTWEYDLHLYLRRVRSLEILYRPGSSCSEQLLEVALSNYAS